MELLDNILRFGTIGLYIWLTIYVLRDWRHQIRGQLAVALFVCMAAYLLSSRPGLSIGAIDIDDVLFPFSALGGLAAWLFCLSQFDDHFTVKPWHWAMVGTKLLLGIGLMFSFGTEQRLFFALCAGMSSAISLGTKLHLAFVIWRGRVDDLMPSRLRFRAIFATGVIVISLGIQIGETWVYSHPGASVPGLLLLQSSAFFVITLFALWRMSGPDGIEIFAFGDVVVGNTAKAKSPEDKHDRKALDGLIKGGVFLEPGLTIAGLAEKLRMPEHRLRRLINQQLGFRNFSDFLNHHRITLAKERLSVVADRHLPVLTIAMDLGYQSLGPFNRAFKERTGHTPSEYRRVMLADEALPKGQKTG